MFKSGNFQCLKGEDKKKLARTTLHTITPTRTRVGPLDTKMKRQQHIPAMGMIRCYTV